MESDGEGGGGEGWDNLFTYALVSPTIRWLAGFARSRVHVHKANVRLHNISHNYDACQAVAL